MTPKSKEELDELLTIAFGQLMIGKDYPNVGQLVGKAIPVFTSYHQQQLERAVREARLDELHRLKVQFISSHWERLRAEVNSWAKYVDRRIAELESTIKEDKPQSECADCYGEDGYGVCPKHPCTSCGSSKPFNCPKCS